MRRRAAPCPLLGWFGGHLPLTTGKACRLLADLFILVAHRLSAGSKFESQQEVIQANTKHSLLVFYLVQQTMRLSKKVKPSTQTLLIPTSKKQKTKNKDQPKTSCAVIQLRPAVRLTSSFDLNGSLPK